MKKESKKLPCIAKVQLIYNSGVPSAERRHVVGSKDAYDIFKAHWNADTIELFEEFQILILNRSNYVLGISQVTAGGTAGTVVDAKLIFQTALLCNATGVILCHNHPSGNLNPSHADLKLTKKLRSGGKLLNLSVLDHLIISKEGYYSFKDRGQL